MNFHVGQKVVLVRFGYKHPYWEHLPRSKLTIGGVYTIREFEPAWIPFNGYPGIRVHEDVGEKVQWNGILIEPSYQHICFRPVAGRETDISIFTAMLKPNKRELVTTSPNQSTARSAQQSSNPQEKA